MPFPFASFVCSFCLRLFSFPISSASLSAQTWAIRDHTSPLSGNFFCSLYHSATASSGSTCDVIYPPLGTVAETRSARSLVPIAGLGRSLLCSPCCLYRPHRLHHLLRSHHLYRLHRPSSPQRQRRLHRLRRLRLPCPPARSPAYVAQTEVRRAERHRILANHRSRNPPAAWRYGRCMIDMANVRVVTYSSYRPAATSTSARSTKTT